MKRLLSAIEDSGAQFAQLSRSFGRTVSIDPSDLLRRDERLNLQQPGIWSPNRHSQMVKARGGWMAVSLARDDDVRSVPAWTGCALDDEPWQAVISYLSQTPCDVALAGAVTLHLPVAQLNEAQEPEQHTPLPASSRADRALTAVDLSALWAGPLCGGLLASAGIEVIRVESPTRPDPTPRTAPDLNRRLNGQKKTLSVALNDPRLMEAIAGADILITSGRPHALARHGITEESIFAMNPALIWVAVTAHGWRGAAAIRTGFGDDCAAAGGLVRWANDTPHFLGDALADPLTGLEGALAVARAIDAGKTGLIDIALAPTAALYASRIGLR